MKRSLILLGITAGMSFISTNLFAAASVSGTADIQFEITGSCTIDTASAGTTYATFSKVYSAGVSTDSSPITTLSVNCTAGMPYKIGANAGVNFVAEQRKLLHVGDATTTLNYYVKENLGANIGDGSVNSFDTGYTETVASTPALDKTGIGAADVTSLVYVVSRTAGEITGQYTDTMTYVVAWP